MNPICCVGGKLHAVRMLVDQIGSLASFFVYDKMATNQAIVADCTSGISGVPGPSATSLLGFPIGLGILFRKLFYKHCFALGVSILVFIESHVKVPGRCIIYILYNNYSTVKSAVISHTALFTVL